MKYFIICLICLSGLTGFSQEKKKPVAVLELISSGKLDKSEVITLTKRFRDMLVQTDVFNVLERDKMDAILKEQDFILSDNCNSAECAVQVGQLLGVEAVVTGDIGKVGDTWTVSLRLVDMTTGKIEKTETMDYQGKIDGMLDVMRQIAFIFAGKQPPKGKTTLIVESGKPTPGRWLIEPSIYYSPDGGFTFDNKSWNKNKKIYNIQGLFISISYMMTQKLKIGLSGCFYNFAHRDTLHPVNTDETNRIGAVFIHSFGPHVGYYLLNSAFKPFIDISAGYFIFTPMLTVPSDVYSINQQEYEKRKNLRKQSGFYADLSIGIDIRLSQSIDFRLAPYILYAKTKPMNGSAALTAGIVYHFGKGFPEQK